MNRVAISWRAVLVLALSVGTAAGYPLATTPAPASAPDGSKYGKYIITEPKPDKRTPEQRADDLPPGPDMLKQMMMLDGEVVKGAFYTEVSWLMKAYPDKVWVKEHAHNFDEVFGLYGSDADNPKELGGEVELYIGGERHLITKSCVVFIPKGLKHCPLTIKRVDRPILFFTTGPSDIYKSDK